MHRSVLFALLTAFLVSTSAGAETNPLLEQILRDTPYTVTADSEIVYRARMIRMVPDSQFTLLKGDAAVRFQDLELTAGRIRVDFQKDLLEATGPPAFSGTDTSAVAADSLTHSGLPVFRDQNTELHGRRMVYNFRSRRGRVLSGRTRYGDGFYYGEIIKKISNRELHMGQCSFTTCELDTPHYHFYAPRMKLLVKDKVIASPVWLYFGNVPTLGIPFAVFSIKTGRRSGLIMPAYSESSRRGHELSHLGYYWAASRYWDSWIRMDYADRGPDYLWVGNLRYVNRDRFQGNINSSYFLSGLNHRTAWDLRATHRQTFTPYLSSNANIRYASSRDYYQEASDNQITRLTRSMTSNFNLSGQLPAWRDSWGLSFQVYSNNHVCKFMGSLCPGIEDIWICGGIRNKDKARSEGYER
jgi:lipopolysaccharide assembly outer membrane protein LptD (OstA)